MLLCRSSICVSMSRFSFAALSLSTWRSAISSLKGCTMMEIRLNFIWECTHCGQKHSNKRRCRNKNRRVIATVAAYEQKDSAVAEYCVHSKIGAKSTVPWLCWLACDGIVQHIGLPQRGTQCRQMNRPCPKRSHRATIKARKQYLYKNILILILLE